MFEHSNMKPLLVDHKNKIKTFLKNKIFWGSKNGDSFLKSEDSSLACMVP